MREPNLELKYKTNLMVELLLKLHLHHHQHGQNLINYVRLPSNTFIHFTHSSKGSGKTVGRHQASSAVHDPEFSLGSPDDGLRDCQIFETSTFFENYPE